MQYIIDRFEGNFAILEAENGEYTGMERARLPREAGRATWSFMSLELFESIARKQNAAVRASVRK